MSYTGRQQENTGFRKMSLSTLSSPQNKDSGCLLDISLTFDLFVCQMKSFRMTLCIIDVKVILKSLSPWQG